jgi:hypothetical protein
MARAEGRVVVQPGNGHAAAQPQAAPAHPDVGRQLLGVGRQLLEMVGRAGEQDLAAVDAAIGEAERGPESLRAVRAVLAAKLGLTAPRRKGGRAKAPAALAGGVPAGPPSKGELTGEGRRQVAAHLARHGATPAAELSAKRSIPYGSMGALMAHEWFTGADTGSVLTPAGNRATREE